MSHEISPLDTAPTRSIEDDSFDWSAVVPRLIHPTKVWIIEAMRYLGRPLSASDLERILAGRADLSAISYHVTSLARAEILERTRKHQIRGAWESHYYFTAAVMPRRS